MAKVKSSLVFKHYDQQQSLLLPPSLDELIPQHHLVRVVNHIVESMDLCDLFNLYEGGGASAYHPRMMLKVLLYAYCMKIYTGRKIASALRQDIHFMWLSASNKPDFRTINLFRTSRAKEVIQTLFAQLLDFLMEHQYIHMHTYFCDGSTFVADGNKNKMVWRKNAQRYKEIVEQKCSELFTHIDQLNATEELHCADQDLAEQGSAAVAITAEALDEHIEKLNSRIRQSSLAAAQKRHAQSLHNKLVKAKSRLHKYDQQLQLAAGRSGYNKTDEDATAMRMKNKVEVLPAYNVMAGSEGQFLTGVSVHQNGNDAICLAEHLEHIEQQQPSVPEQIVADAIFGTERNYALLEQKGIEAYVKYPKFHVEQHKRGSANQFAKENFVYDEIKNSYQCVAGRWLQYTGEKQDVSQRTGYVSVVKQYLSEDCTGCVNQSECCRSQQPDARRSIQFSERLEGYKQQASEKLKSEEGLRLRKQRNVDIESCFGDIKHNMGFRRFHVRGLKKVETEIMLVAMAHNMRKVCLQQARKAV